MIRGMVPVFKLGQTMRGMKESGGTIKPMEEVSSGTLMVIFMKVSGLMIRQTVTAFIQRFLADPLKVIGKMTFKRVKVPRNFQMVASMMDFLSKVSRTAMVSSSGQMNHSMLVIGRMATSMEWETILGPMAPIIRANGSKTRSMAKEFSLGMMVEGTKAITSTIK